MKKLLLILLSGTLITTTVFAGGSIFGGGSKRKNNPEGVTSIGVKVCGSLVCPDVIIKNGDCSGIEHATQQYGVCVCDKGYLIFDGQCVEETEINCKQANKKWCSASKTCSDTGDCCEGVSVQECQSCDPFTGEVRDESAGLCSIDSVPNAGYCLDGECYNPCEVSPIDNCETAGPVLGKCVCSKCEDDYYLDGNLCALCDTPTTSCSITGDIKNAKGCVVQKPIACSNDKPVCNADGECEACPANTDWDGTSCVTKVICPTPVETTCGTVETDENGCPKQKSINCSEATPVCNADGECEACPANTDWDGTSCVTKVICPTPNETTCGTVETDENGCPKQTSINCSEATPVCNADGECEACPTPVETTCGTVETDENGCPKQTSINCSGATPVCNADGECEACPRDQYWAGNACLDCPEGQHGDGLSCESCPSGTFWNEIGRDCQNCPTPANYCVDPVPLEYYPDTQNRCPKYQLFTCSGEYPNCHPDTGACVSCAGTPIERQGCNIDNKYDRAGCLIERNIDCSLTGQYCNEAADSGKGVCVECTKDEHCDSGYTCLENVCTSVGLCQDFVDETGGCQTCDPATGNRQNAEDGKSCQDGTGICESGVCRITTCVACYDLDESGICQPRNCGEDKTCNTETDACICDASFDLTVEPDALVFDYDTCMDDSGNHYKKTGCKDGKLLQSGECMCDTSVYTTTTKPDDTYVYNTCSDTTDHYQITGCAIGYEWLNGDETTHCVPDCADNERLNSNEECVCDGKNQLYYGEPGNCQLCDDPEKTLRNNECVCEPTLYSPNQPEEKYTYDTCTDTVVKYTVTGCATGYEWLGEGAEKRCVPVCGANEVLNASDECVCSDGYIKGDDGVCQNCLENGYGENCELSCDGITCGEHATCVKGACECIDGWRGENCDRAPYDGEDVGVCANGNVYLSYNEDPCAVETPKDMGCVKNSDCDAGYFCNLTSTSANPSYPTQGTCETMTDTAGGTKTSGKSFYPLISSAYKDSTNGGKGGIQWWAAQSWCAARGKKLATLEDFSCTKQTDGSIKCTNSSALYNAFGQYYRSVQTWTADYVPGSLGLGTAYRVTIGKSTTSVDNDYLYNNKRVMCVDK